MKINGVEIEVPAGMEARISAEGAISFAPVAQAAAATPVEQAVAQAVAAVNDLPAIGDLNLDMPQEVMAPANVAPAPAVETTLFVTDDDENAAEIDDCLIANSIESALEILSETRVNTLLVDPEFGDGERAAELMTAIKNSETAMGACKVGLNTRNPRVAMEFARECGGMI